MREPCQPLRRIVGPRAVAPSRDRRAKPFGARSAILSLGPDLVVAATGPVDKPRAVADFGEVFEILHRQRLPLGVNFKRRDGNASGWRPRSLPKPRKDPREQGVLRSGITCKFAGLLRGIHGSKEPGVAVANPRFRLPRKSMPSVS